MRQKFYFCDDLDAPDLCVIMNDEWWLDNREEILKTDGVAAVYGAMLLIPEPEDRLTFVMRWT